MAILRFDFSKSATRAAIIEQLQGHLSAQGAPGEFDAQVRDAGVPDRHHHDFAEVLETIGALRGVSDKVRSDMESIYRILTEAEAKAHGVGFEQAHFHEVGNAAGIEGVLRVCLMMEAAAPEAVLATAVQVGSGTIRCAHGELSVPAPATANIIALGIPVQAERLEGELCTPTSAAMILHFVDEFVA